MPASGSMLGDVGPPIRVGRLTVRGGGRDPGTVRNRAAGQLERLDLMPAGIPPAAVLVIHRLADPTPGRLSLDQLAQTTPWAGAVRDRVATLYRAAERPAAGPVRGDAEAVVFADESELLATYAMDVLNGTASDHWWWRATLGASAARIDTLARVMLHSPTLVPAVFRRLADRDVANSIAQRMTAAQAGAIVEATTRAFGLPEVPARLGRAGAAMGAMFGTAPAPLLARSRTRPRIGSDPSSGLASDEAAVGSQSAEGQPTRTPVVGVPLAFDAQRPPLEPSLAWEQHVLLQVALGLARSPRLVGEPGFPDRVAATWQVARGQEVAGRFTRNIAVDDAPRGGPTARAPHAHDRAPSSIAETIAANETAAAPLAADTGADPEPRLQSDLPGSLRTVALDAAADSVAVVGPAPADHHEPSTSQRAWVDGSETALGGTVFLVNVMAHLDLPDVFEHDWHLATRVGAWGALELLARGLLDDAPAAWADDALWEVLADLDGRAEPLAGRRLRRNPRVRLPESWLRLDAPDAGVLRWAASGGRMVAWSSHGYPVVDELLGDRAPEDAAAQAAAELGLEYDTRSAALARGPGRLRSGALIRDLSPAAIAWLEAVVPFVRRRLALALGRRSVNRQVVAGLLRRQARVYVAAAHLDVVMRPDEVSVAVRRAGLDQDPGWQPAFGRVIRVHFE